MRASPKLGTSSSVIIKSSEKGGKMLLIAIDPEIPVCAPVRSRNIGEDLEQEVVCDVDHSTRPPDSPVPLANPAVWHGITSVAAAVVPSSAPIPANSVPVDQHVFGKSIT
jgi:hypothetical protein